MDDKASLKRNTIVWTITAGLLIGLVIMWMIPFRNRDLKFVFRTLGSEPLHITRRHQSEKHNPPVGHLRQDRRCEFCTPVQQPRSHRPCSQRKQGRPRIPRCRLGFRPSGLRFFHRQFLQGHTQPIRHRDPIGQTPDTSQAGNNKHAESRKRPAGGRVTSQRCFPERIGCRIHPAGQGMRTGKHARSRNTQLRQSREAVPRCI